MLRKCVKCGVEKQEECFYIEAINYIRTDCKECIKNIKKQYRKTKKHDIDGICRSMLRGAKKRSYKKNLPQPDFDWKFLKEIYPKDNKCPILDLELKPSDSIISPNSPTLDRIDPSRPYTKDNVVIICNRANRLKSNASFEELKKLWQFYSEIENKRLNNEQKSDDFR
jgi:hypothetical protein